VKALKVLVLPRAPIKKCVYSGKINFSDILVLNVDEFAV
jgi:hypothetical protein